MINSNLVLSCEQQDFINHALQGKNVLVDACIGSGKTTAIQRLCDLLPQKKNILYLTYNKLLKIDAKAKIKNKNVTVQNYHGFAYNTLKDNGITNCGVPQLIATFNSTFPKIKRYDALIIDEYQDVEQELADMLLYIKSTNPKMQLIAVGDMDQKIYDKTTLNVKQFIDDFLGEYIKLEFTFCFRLSNDIASTLGRIWNKKIVGVNNSCKVEFMSENQIVRFLSKQKTEDVLCLGSRNGGLSNVLNRLEGKYPSLFNKHNVYASIQDQDKQNLSPNNSCAIFTTFDSSKGLERKICVVFDFTESYWDVRINKPQQSYEILRNIFCVAASRGKNRIIFVKTDEELLAEKTISTPPSQSHNFADVDISSMFDFKFREDIEKTYSLLKITKREDFVYQPINVKDVDGLIDLSPAIGIYQEAVFFDDYTIERAIDLYATLNPDKIIEYTCDKSHLQQDILKLVSLETSQNRYLAQVQTPFVYDDDKTQIIERLSKLFNRKEDIQQPCEIEFLSDNGKPIFTAKGLADVVKNNVVYELKFVPRLTHEHFLQCACYAYALKIPKGVLYNTKTNEYYEIEIPNRQEFYNWVMITVSKGVLGKR